MRHVIAAVACVSAMVVADAAHADTIALLPLDGEKRLEIYGQPVASEIGRALEAKGIDVVVVGAKMAVPEGAQLIVDGSIRAEKSNAITLSLRIRDPKTGTVLETLPASAATLTTIDKAAGELAGRLVPVVQTHLAALKAKPAVTVVSPPPPPADDSKPRPAPPAPVLPAIATSATAPVLASPALDLLAGALRGEAETWANARRQAAAQGAQIAFDVLRFDVQPGEVPLARARVRARIVAGGATLFERVIRTDTIVGDKGITEQELAARTAREVIAIGNAQLRRVVTGWR